MTMEAVTLDTEGYGTLAAVLLDAFTQASAGKGKERHACALPFDQQPMQKLADLYGPGFVLGQAAKKSQESQRLPYERARAELLGAIVYTAGAIIALDRAHQREEPKLDLGERAIRSSRFNRAAPQPRQPEATAIDWSKPIEYVDGTPAFLSTRQEYAERVGLTAVCPHGSDSERSAGNWYQCDGKHWTGDCMAVRNRPEPTPHPACQNAFGCVNPMLCHQNNACQG